MNPEIIYVIGPVSVGKTTYLEKLKSRVKVGTKDYFYSLLKSDFYLDASPETRSKLRVIYNQLHLLKNITEAASCPKLVLEAGSWQVNSELIRQLKQYNISKVIGLEVTPEDLLKRKLLEREKGTKVNDSSYYALQKMEKQIQEVQEHLKLIQDLSTIPVLRLNTSTLRFEQVLQQFETILEL